MARKQIAKRAQRRPNTTLKRRGTTNRQVERAELPSEKHAEKQSESKSTAPPFLVAGVGASAGGLEAFTRMLAPIGGGSRLAVVLVQHLSRTHQSMLPTLLAAKTTLAVREARDGAAIEPGTVYVIRPDTRMTVIDGNLRVVPRPTDQGADAPIDRLFESLAEQYKDKAIGIVLSGSGHDGAAGARLIKAAGGIVLVQEPTEAQVDGMPRAAITSDAADLVLPAKDIAAELMRLSRHPFFDRPDADGSNDASEEGTDEATEYRPVFQLLRRTTGVDFTHYKSPTIRRRVRRRMALHRLQELPEYVKFLQKNPKEVQSLHDDILIHVTGFFREPESFVALTKVFEEIVQAHQDGTPIRAWVPGCSSGEEAYSLTIALLEYLDDRHDIQIQTFGTDVSQKMIDRARVGLYPQSAFGSMTPERLRRFFVSVDGGYRVTTTVRERCVFARQDITRDPPFSKLDIVLCRNLLIYLGPQLQRRAVGIFHYALHPQGFLMLGRSETIGAHPDLFSVTDGRWKIYRRKAGTQSPREMEFGAPAVPPAEPPKLGQPGQPAPRSRQEWDVQGEANRLLLDRHAPPSIIVDEDSRIVRSRGHTSRFLELPNGDASLDALKMVRAGLLAPLRSALMEARPCERNVRKEALRIHTDDGTHRVNLDVTPLGRGESRHYLIQFETGEELAKPAAKRAQRKGNGEDPALQQLEEELSATREHLQSMIQDLEAANEELQSANEEILSSNEELQSTNEELDTAREELQSTNEELSTVNDELQSRNLQLTEANSDLVNLLASVQIPIVMVGADLRIRRFTPAAERVLNLIPSDVGRPIGHIKPNIRSPDLEAMIRDVVDMVSVREREVTDNDGNTYILRARPYKSVENRIDGAVLALFDVSAAFKLARETGEAIMARLPEAALLLDTDLMVQRANRAFYTIFQTSPRETEGKPVFELDSGNWNLPGLRRLLENVLPAQKTFDGFPVEQTFTRVGTKQLLLDARRIESDRLHMILLVIREDRRENA
jgi:two-component system, chemotaxis family, CheB/CheR fusion protein